MKIAFATCDHKPLLTNDDQLLADALSALGVVVTPIPWTEIDPYAVLDSSPILLRSTWPTTASATLLDFADRVMGHVPATCLYARVDAVVSSRGPLLMELELIEPELYFLFAPGAAHRLAQLLVSRLQS